MWSAGIAWNGDGYQAVCAHPDGGTLGPRAFRADKVAPLVAWLRETCGPDVSVVIDSTNGLLDERLRDGGLRVFRADPWDLPERSAVSGSVPAAALAARGLRGAPALNETDAASGTMRGRLRELGEETRRAERELAGRGACVERGPGASRQVALTFDDGPNPPYTERILGILGRYDVAATFFLVGMHAAVAQDTVARMREAGHGIGNHTWSHPYMPDLSGGGLRFQVDSTNEAIAAVTGEHPVLFRPPYGSRTAGTLRGVAGQGMTTVLWDRDTGDWARPGAAAIAARALDGICGGSIVLMHDGGGDRSQTVEALPGIIEWLLANEYELVTVAHMLK